MGRLRGEKGGPGPADVGLGPEEKEARRIVRRAAISAALAGASPIPLGGVASVPAVQAKMLVGLAKVFGRSMELREARDLAGFLGGATALRYVVRLLTRTVVRRLPAVGAAAGAATAFGSTFALGLVGIRYFRPDAGRVVVEPADSTPFADREGFEREARTLRLEWESGAISEETYSRDLQALGKRFLSSQDNPPDDL